MSTNGEYALDFSQEGNPNLLAYENTGQYLEPKATLLGNGIYRWIGPDGKINYGGKESAPDAGETVGDTRVHTSLDVQRSDAKRRLDVAEGKVAAIAYDLTRESNVLINNEARLISPGQERLQDIRSQYDLVGDIAARPIDAATEVLDKTELLSVKFVAEIENPIAKNSRKDLNPTLIVKAGYSKKDGLELGYEIKNKKTKITDEGKIERKRSYPIGRNIKRDVGAAADVPNQDAAGFTEVGFDAKAVALTIKQTGVSTTVIKPRVTVTPSVPGFIRVGPDFEFKYNKDDDE